MHATPEQVAWTHGYDAARQTAYQAGYQAALADVLRAFDRGGQEAALAWIEANQHA
jgi:hypothetical protein